MLTRCFWFSIDKGAFGSDWFLLFLIMNFLLVQKGCVDTWWDIFPFLVHIDPSLQFNQHVDHVYRSITSKIAVLRRIKRYIPLSYRELYYNAYILPCINYCLTIWGNAAKTHMERIHKLQKCAARIILDAPPDVPSLPLFSELGWLTVFERVEFNKGILLYKALHDMCPEYITNMFKFQSPSYGLRSSSNQQLSIPKHNNKLFKK